MLCWKFTTRSFQSGISWSLWFESQNRLRISTSTKRSKSSGIICLQSGHQNFSSPANGYAPSWKLECSIAFYITCSLNFKLFISSFDKSSKNQFKESVQRKNIFKIEMKRKWIWHLVSKRSQLIRSRIYWQQQQLCLRWYWIFQHCHLYFKLVSLKSGCELVY